MSSSSSSAKTTSSLLSNRILQSTVIPMDMDVIQTDFKSAPLSAPKPAPKIHADSKTIAHQSLVSPNQKTAEVSSLRAAESKVAGAEYTSHYLYDKSVNQQRLDAMIEFCSQPKNYFLDEKTLIPQAEVLDHAVSFITGVDVNLLYIQEKDTYVANMAKDPSEVKDKNLLGWYVLEYFPILIRNLFEIILKNKKSLLREVLYKEILMSLDLYYIETILVQFEKYKLAKARYRDFATLIAHKIESLPDGEQFRISGKWKPHRVSIVFIKQGSIVGVRIDNAGSGCDALYPCGHSLAGKRVHEIDSNNVDVFPALIGIIDLDSSGHFQKLVNYIVGVFEARLNNSQLGMPLVYDFKGNLLSAQKFKIDYPKIATDQVNDNCVIFSYQISFELQVMKVITKKELEEFYQLQLAIIHAHPKKTFLQLSKFIRMRVEVFFNQEYSLLRKSEIIRLIFQYFSTYSKKPAKYSTDFLQNVYLALSGNFQLFNNSYLLSNYCDWMIKLTVIDLSFSHINNEDIFYLAKILPALKKLTSLNLSGNLIGSAGAFVLSKYLLGSSLEILNLKSNQIGDEGAIAIANVLDSKRSNIDQLSIHDNNPMGDKGFVALANAIKTNPIFKYLYISCSMISLPAYHEMVMAVCLNSSILHVGVDNRPEDSYPQLNDGKGKETAALLYKSMQGFLQRNLSLKISLKTASTYAKKSGLSRMP